MDRLDAMRLFVRVVETGSFSAVAREAGVGQPAVSKQIAALEQHLGASLLNRSSRALNLTDAGQVYYDATVRLLEDLDHAETSVGRGQTQPSGLLRVALSAGFGRLYVVPMLADFHRRYPDIVTDIVVSDRFVDLIEEGIDVAIRLGELSPSQLIARRIGTSARVTVAAPAYLDRNGAPAHPRDLHDHARIAFTFQRRKRDWEFSTPEGPLRHTPDGPVRANDAEHIRAAALAGLGIVQAPNWLFSDDIQAGTLREVLVGYPGLPFPIHAVLPAGRQRTSRVRAFVDHIAATFAAIPSLNAAKVHSSLE